MTLEVTTAVISGILAMIAAVTALVTAKVSAQNSATKEELEDLRRRVDNLKNDLLIERDSNDKLRAQITAAEDSVVAAVAEKRELKIQLDDMKADLRSRDKQIKEQDDIIKKQDARIKDLEARVKEMENLMLGKQNGSDCAGLEKP